MSEFLFRYEDWTISVLLRIFFWGCNFFFKLSFPFKTAVDVLVHEGRISLYCTLMKNMCDLHQGCTLLRMALPPQLWFLVTSSYSFVAPKYYLRTPSRPVLAQRWFFLYLYHFIIFSCQNVLNFPGILMGRQSVWDSS